MHAVFQCYTLELKATCMENFRLIVAVSMEKSLHEERLKLVYEAMYQ